METQWVILTIDKVMELLEMNEKVGVANKGPGEISKWVNSGPSWALLIDDKVAMCGGAIIKEEVGEIWMIPSPVFYKHIKTCIKCCLHILVWGIKHYKVKKLQALIKEGDKEGRRWAEHFGFSLEKRLESYGPNKENYGLYVREETWQWQV